MKTALETLPLIIVSSTMIWTFLFVLRTGRLGRALMVNWIVCIVAIGPLVSLSYFLAAHEVREVLPEGPHFLMAIFAGWANGLIPGVIAKILFARRRCLAETPTPEQRQ